VPEHCNQHSDVRGGQTTEEPGSIPGTEQTLFCTPPTEVFIQGISEVLCTEIQRQGCNASDIPAPNENVMNGWSYTSTPSDIFMTWFSMTNNCLYDLWAANSEFIIIPILKHT
jgi:hypothetical protein